MSRFEVSSMEENKEKEEEDLRLLLPLAIKISLHPLE